MNPGPGSPGAQPPNNNIGQPRSAFSSETGSPGILRFFQSPLSAEMSWLLPFALVSLFVLAFQARIKLPVESGAHLGLILWGGWLLTCAIFLSLISGIFHAYYVVMLVPALGAVVGGGFGSLVEEPRPRGTRAAAGSCYWARRSRSDSRCTLRNSTRWVRPGCCLPACPSSLRRSCWQLTCSVPQSCCCAGHSP